jgi:hypothetical protein
VRLGRAWEAKTTLATDVGVRDATFKRRSAAGQGPSSEKVSGIPAWKFRIRCSSIESSVYPSPSSKR